MGKKNLNYDALRQASIKVQKEKEKKQKRNIIIAIAIPVAIALIAAVIIIISSANKETYVPLAQVQDEINAYSVSDFEESEEESKYIIIKVKNYGDIVCELRGDVAPITVKNIKKLVSEKFYDGLIFHRVIEDFMIQGGGITQSYTQKESPAIKGEFSSNGVKNDLLHYRGVLSMARTSVKNSASSQFFIMHQTSPHLDGDYAAFGYVLAGMDVVDKIATTKTNGNDMPLEDVIIESIRFANKK